ncbi:MAG: GEVED domain-containing protein, partial [Cyanobacteria bacterium P01_A01_bin.83]
DEDGVSSFPTLTTAEGQTYTVSVIANNNVPLEDAYLVGYIDFNQDGDFEDTGEQSTTVTVPTSTSNPRTFDVTFTTPAGMTTGTTYARFRLGQVQATAEQATGASISTDNGEIEDYSLEIAEIDGNRPLGFPFTCDSTFYITIGQGGTNPQFLYRVNRAGDTFVFDEIGSSTSSANGYPTTFRYNALAYNPVDNYLYGYIQGSSAATGPYAVGNVVQIGSNGVLHSIGIPTDGSGGTLPLNSYYAASMLSDGTYVIGRGSDFAKLDVTTSPPTILSTGSISGASFTDFAVDPTDPTSLSGGRIYGINESGSSDRLVILDVTGNNPTIVSQATNPTGNNHNAGSQFVDSFGTLYYRSNSDAKLYRVDSDATSATYGVATEITTAPTGGSHDGASCLFASVMEKEVQDLDGNLITTSPAGEVVNYVYRIASGNVLDISGVTFEDDLRNVTGGDPINGTFNGNFTVSNGSGTVSFSNSNQTIQISDLIIPAQTLATSDSDIVTITAEVEVPNSLTTGEYLNQAFISNLPAQYPSLISSDYPASAAYEDPTPLQVTEPLASDPELTLVKRITAINPGQPEREILFNEYVDDGVADNADNEPNWLGSQPSPDGNTNTYTLGAIDGGQVQPGDVIEYTIYFLSHGDGTAENVLVCDLIPENTEFLVHDFDTLPGSAGGVAGSDRGLAWEYNGATESLTNGSDGDGGYYFVPGVEPTSIADLSSVQCGATNLPNTNGAVVVNLANLSPATAPGVPTDSYGLIRFRVRVQ